jgi:hypothetical protein
MSRSPHRLKIRRALLALVLSILSVVITPLAVAQPAPNPFNDQRFLGTATPTPTPDDLTREQPAPKKPPPRGLKIAIVAALLAIALVVLAFSVRAWRVGNLFDREYRFPVATTIAVRLGARRCGGCMATIKFRDRAGPV